MLVTIHGHFYQPPRENPWTGEIPLQESAAPAHDWNQRITEECYGPNGRSRVLDPDGRILSILNNYLDISFDFGPTLLSDLERRFPDVYRRVLEADRESVARHHGHGNAFAQAYNHMILPLANEADKRTQVRWGLRDFEHRFGRRSEGLWLPETACDHETLQVLAECSVKFIVLAPHQALRCRRLGEREWRELSPRNPIDTSRPYRCFIPAPALAEAGPSAPGSRGVEPRHAAPPRRWVDVFFYDGALSVAASFEHLLRSADVFASQLQSAGAGLPAEGLVQMATDGEVYGHHEPFADMCLAYLLQHEGPRRGFRFLNYGEALAMNPPTWEVELNFTDTGEGTAWSCAHGVGRWTRDCGCSTGAGPGWNQRWRTPLRRGLDAVRDRIQGAFLLQTSPLLKDPWAARDDSIELLLRPDAETREAFLGRHLRAPVDAGGRRMVLSLLEANHQAMLMYTSCAWFFGDVSGLEVQQTLGYASRACELAQPYVSEPLEPLLLRYLEQARSNLAEWGNGANVYRRIVQPRRVGPEHAAARAAFEAVGRSLNRRAYRYTVSGSLGPAEGERNGAKGDARGQLCVFDEAVEQSWCWGFEVTAGSLERREVRLAPAVDREARVAPFRAALQLRDLPREVREEIALGVLGQALREETERIEELYREARAPMVCLLELGLPVPEIHRDLACHVLNERFAALIPGVKHDPAPLPEAWWGELEKLREESASLALACDLRPLSAALARRINALLDLALWEERPAPALAYVSAAYATMARADELTLPLPRTGHEPRAYDLVLRFRDDLADLQDGREAEPGGLWQGLRALRDLARHANLQFEAILRDATARGDPVFRMSPAGEVNRNAQG